MMDKLIADQIETWEINNRVNLYLLDALTEADLALLAPGMRGRNVGKQFAHLHNVRLMWLKASAPELLTGLDKLEDEPLSMNMLRSALEASCAAMKQLLIKGFESGKVKNFKPHPAAFLGYLLAHEGHHRGQIILHLKLAGRVLDKKVSFGLWEWGKFSSE